MAISAFDVQVGKILVFTNDYKVDDSLPVWANNSPGGYTYIYGSGGGGGGSGNNVVITNNSSGRTVIPKGTRIKIIGIMPNLTINSNPYSITYSLLSENGYNLNLELQEICSLSEIITEDNPASKVLYGSK